MIATALCPTSLHKSIFRNIWLIGMYTLSIQTKARLRQVSSRLEFQKHIQQCSNNFHAPFLFSVMWLHLFASFFPKPQRTQCVTTRYCHWACSYSLFVVLICMSICTFVFHKQLLRWAHLCAGTTRVHYELEPHATHRASSYFSVCWTLLKIQA